METIFYSTTHTPLVPLFIASGPRGLVAVRFMTKGRFDPGLEWLRHKQSGAELVESPEKNRQVSRELEAYAAGELQKFTVALDLRGTPFQISVLRALLEIPYGQTRSYAEVARGIGHPKALRAVGLANRLNPICVVVPCHRVIASNGDLCGFGGGLELKRRLLDHERAHTLLAESAGHRNVQVGEGSKPYPALCPAGGQNGPRGAGGPFSRA